MISLAFHRFAAFILAFTLGMGYPSGAEASSTIPFVPDDEIQGFLFQIPESLREQARTLDPDPTRRFSVPLLFGLAPARITDSWGEARDGGRIHKGIDIVAPRGTFVLSPTDALVTNVGYDNLGGNYVLSANPGGEQFYYAHLEDFAPGILPGKVLKRGDLIGYVGNTGNARQSLSHLHLGIYSKGAATNPYPRLTRGFSLEEHIAILEEIAGDPGVPFSITSRAISTYKDFLGRAQEAGFTFPRIVAWVLNHTDILAKAREFQGAIVPGSRNEGARFLQEFLIQKSAGPAARALAEAGATGYFGARTQNALTEYQVANGIVPAEGYFDPLTKARILDALPLNVPEVSSEDEEVPLFQQFLNEARGYLLFTQVLPDREGAGENREREGEGELVQDEFIPM